MSSLKSHKDAFDRDEVAALAVTMSGRQIARHYGVSPRTMARRMKEWGIEGAWLKLRDMDEVERLYLAGMTTIELAKKYGATPSRVSEALRGRGVQMRPRGHKKNRAMSDEQKAKISAFRRGNFCGERNPNWRGGKGPVDQKERASYKSKEWSKAVRSRDGHACRECGVTGVKLHAHHVRPWKHHPELRFEVSNGLTVCQPCHQRLHGFRFPWLHGENGTSAQQAQA